MLPVAIALTNPESETDAMVESLVPQTPPGIVEVNVATVPSQRVLVPVITAAVGALFTVTLMVAVEEPQTLLISYDIVVMPESTPVTRSESR